MVAEANSKIEAYFEAWVSSLASLLSQLSGNDWQPQPASAPEAYTPVARVRVTACKGLEGRQWLSFSAADVEALLRPFLQDEISIATRLDQQQQDALAEMVRQWSGLAASALEAAFGEVSLETRVEPAVQNASPAARLLHASDGSRTVAVLLEMDDAIVGALDRRASPRPSDNPSAEIEGLLRQGNLGLLMDVELGVMLRFGCRQATLREVLELTSGAVLELDREIQEPVDLLLNGRVIARGDVVVIGGNYGLRVTEVASPQQRVDSL
ncbi:MAG: flagellar motor switch protein FliN [Candidatus Korobacteraceae bacterium]